MVKLAVSGGMVNREITLHPDERVPTSGWLSYRGLAARQNSFTTVDRP